MSDPIKAFEFIHQSWDFSAIICLLWMIWAFFVFWTLEHPGPGRGRFLNTLQNACLVQFYRNQLVRFLNFTVRSWFKDKECIEDQRLLFRQPSSKKFVIGINTFTESAFVFSLKLALIYPILSIFMFWVISATGGNPGGISILPEMKVEFRVLTLVLILVTLKILLKALNSQGLKFYIWMLFAVAVAVTGAGAVAVSIAVAISVAIAGAGAGAFAFAVGFAFVGAVGFADPVAIAVSVYICFLADIFYKFCNSRHFLKWFWMMYLVLIVLMDGLLIHEYADQFYDTNTLVILLFYSILPIFNAPMDWLSTAITRSLLYAIVDRFHSGIQAFLWAVLDLLIALALFIVITIVLTIAIAEFNHVAIAGGGQAIVDLTRIFISLFNEPSAIENWWIYFMLLSTLVPTLLHIMIAGFSVILWIPEYWLTWVSQEWSSEQHKDDAPKFFLAWGYFTVVSPLAIIAPFALLGGSIWLLLQPGSGDQIGNWLLNTAYNIASSIDSSVAEIPDLMESKVN